MCVDYTWSNLFRLQKTEHSHTFWTASFWSSGKLLCLDYLTLAFFFCSFSEAAVQFLETSFSKHQDLSHSERNHKVSGTTKAFFPFLWWNSSNSTGSLTEGTGYLAWILHGYKWGHNEHKLNQELNSASCAPTDENSKIPSSIAAGLDLQLPLPLAQEAWGNQ